MDPSSRPGVPRSSLFEVRATRLAGRAVFATDDIPASTIIFRAPDLTLDVILREYRREVCAFCFAYDNGRELAIREASLGFSYCTEDCQNAWKTRNGALGMEAWTNVETLVRRRRRDDDEMVDAQAPRPDEKAIHAAWEVVREQANLIREARASNITEHDESPGSAMKNVKRLRKALRRALMAPVSADILTFCVSGLIWRYHNEPDWPHLTALATDRTPYHSHDNLDAFVRAYLQLLAVLPTRFLPITTPETLVMLSTRDSHNSFGIRSLEDDGSEFFGYGCWPSASYFNHSCGPNLEKKRDGRVWTFTAGRDIVAGEELCITYLSGEERKMSRGNRWALLKRNWGFECACDRCEI